MTKKKAPTPRQKSQGQGSSEMLVQQCLKCELVEKKTKSDVFLTVGTNQGHLWMTKKKPQPRDRSPRVRALARCLCSSASSVNLLKKN